MYNHREFAAGRLIGARGKEKGDELWKALTRELNSLGIEKTQIQWQKAWKDIKTRVRPKAVSLKNAPIKTGNFPMDDNTLSKEDLMILGLIGPAATEGCRVSDSMPEEISAITQLREADESVLNEISTHISVVEEYNIVSTNTIIGSQRVLFVESDTAIGQEEEHTIQESDESKHLSEPKTFVEVVCGEDGIGIASSSHTLSHPSLQQTTPNIKTATHTCQSLAQEIKEREDDVFKTVVEMQEKQNEILERMSQAMLISANNEAKRLELENDKLEVKRQICQALNSIAVAMTGFH
ncbi:uncharacterized protein LOC124305567 [Neodiprion virginianus]|uniref:uncharacterized protein LOC124305567 n=1 Tax=Neodiprion virginianus TaxID=2961670 RepID=UPI001EE7470E|nr:uncharacterized protein LOC124305567 [Neodiprion virginianus]